MASFHGLVFLYDEGQWYRRKLTITAPNLAVWTEAEDSNVLYGVDLQQAHISRESLSLDEHGALIPVVRIDSASGHTFLILPVPDDQYYNVVEPESDFVANMLEAIREAKALAPAPLAETFAMYQIQERPGKDPDNFEMVRAYASQSIPDDIRGQPPLDEVMNIANKVQAAVHSLSELMTSYEKTPKRDLAVSCQKQAELLGMLVNDLERKRELEEPKYQAIREDFITTVPIIFEKYAQMFPRPLSPEPAGAKTGGGSPGASGKRITPASAAQPQPIRPQPGSVAVMKKELPPAFANPPSPGRGGTPPQSAIPPGRSEASSGGVTRQPSPCVEMPSPAPTDEKLRPLPAPAPPVKIPPPAMVQKQRNATGFNTGWKARRLLCNTLPYVDYLEPSSGKTKGQIDMRAVIGIGGSVRDNIIDLLLATGRFYHLKFSSESEMGEWRAFLQGVMESVDISMRPWGGSTAKKGSNPVTHEGAKRPVRGIMRVVDSGALKFSCVWKYLPKGDYSLFNSLIVLRDRDRISPDSYPPSECKGSKLEFTLQKMKKFQDEVPMKLFRANDGITLLLMTYPSDGMPFAADVAGSMTHFLGGAMHFAIRVWCNGRELGLFNLGEVKCAQLAGSELLSPTLYHIPFPGEPGRWDAVRSAKIVSELAARLPVGTHQIRVDAYWRPIDDQMPQYVGKSASAESYDTYLSLVGRAQFHMRTRPEHAQAYILYPAVAKAAGAAESAHISRMNAHWELQDKRQEAFLDNFQWGAGFNADGYHAAITPFKKMERSARDQSVSALGGYMALCGDAGIARTKNQKMYP